MKLTHFSLFTGIGGIDLAASWAGFETVGMCEIDEYCRQVLDKHWPDVPKWRDVKDVTKESIKKAGIGAIRLISGGFPCQPYSIAGKRRGKADNRDLWFEMLRAIQELKPGWVLGENVANFVNMGLEEAIADLESLGFEVQPFLIPACGVKAVHKRERLFIVAHSASNRLEGELHESCNDKNRPFKTFSPHEICDNEEQLSPPYVIGGYERLPCRVDRTRCLGNAVVPQQVYPILKAIAEIEGVTP